MSGLGLEARVGAFVLAALAILIGFVLALGDFRLTPGVTLHADFAYTSGLQVGAPVMMSGIRLGKVSGLGLLGADAEPAAASPHDRLGQRQPPLVRAQLDLDPQSLELFADDAQLHIGTQGLIGESYIELTPGRGAKVTPGAALRGVDAPRLHVMALQLSALLNTTGALLGSAEEDLDLGGLGESVGSLLSTINGLVGERRAELGQAITDMTVAAGDLRLVMRSTRDALKDGQTLAALLDDGGAVIKRVRGELPDLLTQARASLTSLQSLAEKADGVMDSEALAEILASTRRTTDRLENLTRDAEALLASMQRGEGTVGALLQDPQIYDDVKEMLRDLKRNPWKFLWRD